MFQAMLLHTLYKQNTIITCEGPNIPATLNNIIIMCEGPRLCYTKNIIMCEGPNIVYVDVNHYVSCDYSIDSLPCRSTKVEYLTRLVVT